MQYTVKSGDTLASIALAYGLDTAGLAAANNLASADWLQVGQFLTIPAPQPTVAPSDFKIIPDSELVYGPVSSTLDVAAFIQTQGGYLSRYSEVYDGVTMTGTQIVSTLSKEYSVNPRLLLALLEYQSGWVTQSQPSGQGLTYPLGLIDTSHQGLYVQLSWAANELNRGFYLWGVNALASVQLADDNLVTFPATLNASTVSVQRFFAMLDGASVWTAAVSENGMYATYTRFFGIPFDLAVEPLLPANLSQPVPCSFHSRMTISGPSPAARIPPGEMVLPGLRSILLPPVMLSAVMPAIPGKSPWLLGSLPALKMARSCSTWMATAWNKPAGRFCTCMSPPMTGLPSAPVLKPEITSAIRLAREASRTVPIYIWPGGIMECGSLLMAIYPL
jgi:LysM repeat protein